jgi:LuxR family transcriptional regulator, maltose regulon positive regulatory protein
MPKLYRATPTQKPQPQPHWVVRSRLLDYLGKPPQIRLGVITAPGGWGKTTLGVQWAIHTNRHTAWVNLEPADNSPNRFLRNVLDAFAQINPALVARAGLARHLPGYHNPQQVITPLLRAIQEHAEPFLLVLDDYQTIEAAAVHQAAAALIENQPANLQILILSQTPLPFNLAALHTLGQVREVGADQLAFTPDETQELFAALRGPALEKDHAARITRAAGGWVVLLQLLAVHPRRADGVEVLLKESRSPERSLGWLLALAFNSLPKDEQNLLATTCVVDGVDGGLAAALCGLENPLDVLAALLQKHFFLAPCGASRDEYRLQPVVQYFLRGQLSEPVHRALLRRAAGWYAARGWLLNAVEAALEAGEIHPAARLLAAAGPESQRTANTADFLDLANRLPQEIRPQTPRLAFYEAWSLFSTGETETTPTLLAILRTQLSLPPACLYLIEAQAALAQADYPSAARWAARAITSQDQRPAPGTPEHASRDWDEETSLALAAAALIQAQAARHQEQTGLAQIAFTNAASLADSATAPSLQLETLGSWASLRLETGDLPGAEALLRQGVSLLNSLPSAHPLQRLAPVVYRPLGYLLYEWNRVNEAAEIAQKLADTARLAHNPASQAGASHLAALCALAQGDHETALKLTGRVDSQRVRMHAAPPAQRTPVDVLAMELRLYLAERLPVQARMRLDEVQRWLDGRGLLEPARAVESLNPSRTAEYTLLADYLIRSGNPARALELLEPLVTQAESSGLNGVLIGHLLLRTRAYLALGDQTAARQTLEQTRRLGEPAGYLRAFLDAGQAVRELTG